ncbi:MAG: hypothetical protein ACYCPS_04430 [Candidatus Saccharimonadales bacterium]
MPDHYEGSGNPQEAVPYKDRDAYWLLSQRAVTTPDIQSTVSSPVEPVVTEVAAGLHPEEPSDTGILDAAKLIELEDELARRKNHPPYRSKLLEENNKSAIDSISNVLRKHEIALLAKQDRQRLALYNKVLGERRAVLERLMPKLTGELLSVLERVVTAALPTPEELEAQQTKESSISAKDKGDGPTLDDSPKPEADTPPLPSGVITTVNAPQGHYVNFQPINAGKPDKGTDSGKDDLEPIVDNEESEAAEEEKHEDISVVHDRRYYEALQLVGATGVEPPVQEEPKKITATFDDLPPSEEGQSDDREDGEPMWEPMDEDADLEDESDYDDDDRYPRARHAAPRSPLTARNILRGLGERLKKVKEAGLNAQINTLPGLTRSIYDTVARRLNRQEWDELSGGQRKGRLITIAGAAAIVFVAAYESLTGDTSHRHITHEALARFVTNSHVHLDPHTSDPASMLLSHHAKSTHKAVTANSLLNTSKSNQETTFKGINLNSAAPWTVAHAVNPSNPTAALNEAAARFQQQYGTSYVLAPNAGTIMFMNGPHAINPLDQFRMNEILTQLAS